VASVATNTHKAASPTHLRRSLDFLPAADRMATSKPPFTMSNPLLLPAHALSNTTAPAPERDSVRSAEGGTLAL
jgi:hypothetical protein